MHNNNFSYAIATVARERKSTVVFIHIIVNGRAIALGSGFLVTPDGYIVTNHHVIDGASRIIIEKFDESKGLFEANLISYDDQLDLAILKIDVQNFPHATFADSDQVQVGQWTVAIGHPYGKRFSVSAGIISSIERENLFQMDTAINAGNSGGPLFNLDGEVVGVTTSALTTGGGDEGVNFSVPGNLAKKLLALSIDH